MARYQIVGGPVYLLAWQQREDDWWAWAFWVEQQGGEEIPAYRREWVPGRYLQRMYGQDYSGIPQISRVPWK